jgi:hypothetical protein
VLDAKLCYPHRFHESRSLASAPARIGLPRSALACITESKFYRSKLPGIFRLGGVARRLTR